MKVRLWHIKRADFENTKAKDLVCIHSLAMTFQNIEMARCLSLSSHDHERHK